MSDQPFTHPHTAAIVDVLCTIRLVVRAESLPEMTFVLGIRIERGMLVVDAAHLRDPAGLLRQWLGMTIDPTQRSSRCRDPFPHMRQSSRTTSGVVEAQ